jgi:signal transduction histidine kinase
LDKDKPDVDEARSALLRAVNDVNRIDEVITSVRTMIARQTSEKVLLKLPTILNEALALTERELVSRRISVHYNVPDNVPLVVADRVQLRQVFVNLIMNAAEAMDEVVGRDHILAIAIGNDELEVTITIADNGSGIDETKRTKIFEPFFTTKIKGMGLGLAICKTIIEAHEGRLWTTPNVPSGTIFHLALPLSDKIKIA